MISRGRTHEPTKPSADVIGRLRDASWQALAGVKDPEIPVIDVVELGVVRGVEVGSGEDGIFVQVTITPTFSACPALHEIERNVTEAIAALGVEPRVTTTLSPPWSTDDMTDEARSKLREFGIAPPGRHGGLLEIALDAPVRCPRCDHPDTRVRNAFGSTLCREIRTCAACDETFERFKPL